MRLTSRLATAGTTLVLAATGVVSATSSPQQSAAAAPDDALVASIDTLLADPRFEGTSVAVVVREADSGETVYARNPDLRLLPASNAKLFTSAAAADTLGTDFRMVTDVLATGRVRGGNLRGSLVLRGGGDPTMLAADYAHLAEKVADAGIRRVRGNLLADDSYFDDVPLGDSWAWDDEPFYYAAVTSALTVAPDTDYDAGTVIIEAGPSTQGAPPTVTMTPRTSVVRIVNTATTGAAGSADTLSIQRDHGSNVVRITGSVPVDGDTIAEWSTVEDPTAYAADVFRRALAAEGVRVQGIIREGTTPADARTVASHASMSLGELLVPFMKLSNNMHAEALVKTMGAETTGDGSWDAGLAVIDEFAATEGVDDDDLRLVDGSGLSRKDLATGDAITDLLIGVRDESWFDTWYASLPVAGVPERLVGGTLRNRMRDTPAAGNVRGKTGSLTGVTALSGYVSDADGRELVFSMISNNYLDSPRSVEDALAVTLASWTAGGDAPRVAPRTLRSRQVPDGLECSWVKAC
jgi:D-alanyl-D-alanine carboxypeptidase/D-alanyl-D-alanine-endopeptidase (penicillin-binding protein 4)